MDSNYYDEERMMNEMNDALNYDPDAGFYDMPDHSEDPYGYLADFELKEKTENLTKLKLDDFSKFPIKSTFEDVEYLGWSYFSRDFISFHFSIQDNYYHSCVHNKSFLEDNFEFLKSKGATILEFNGIKKNSKGENYPAVYMSFRFPLEKR